MPRSPSREACVGVGGCATDSEVEVDSEDSTAVHPQQRSQSPSHQRDEKSDSEQEEGGDKKENSALVAPAAAKDADGYEAPFVWRVPVKQLRDSKTLRTESSVFQLDSLWWRMLCFPCGNPVNISGPIAMYIELVNYAWASMHSVCTAHFKFKLIHPTDASRSFEKDSHHHFSRAEIDRGFTDLLPADQIPAFTHADNCVVVHIYAKKEESMGAYGRFPGWSDYDSKASTGFAGLKNQGATCYMNSMLQALYLIPKFREIVYQMQNEAEDKGTKIGLALQRVFYQLQTSKTAVSTRQLTSSFGWGSVDAFMQHDVQEFCRVLLDSLDTTTKKTSLSGVIQSLFEGKTEAYIACVNVDYKSSRIESFWDIAMNVKGCANLEASFKSYIEEEMLDGQNKYRAEGHGLQVAKKGTRFLSFPPILQLQLKRFNYDFMMDQMVKINDRFEFPTELDLSSFVTDLNPADPPVYLLHSVLVHSGGVQGGHYVLYARPFLKSISFTSSHWYKFDDESVYLSSEEEAVAGNFGNDDSKMQKGKGGFWGGRSSSSNAYMLIYLRKSFCQPILDKQNQFATEKKEKKEGDEKQEKKEDKKVEKSSDIHEQFDVSIPEPLTTRFLTEEQALIQKREASKNAHLYMDLRYVVENELINAKYGVGTEYTTQSIDASSGLFDMNNSFKETKVLRKNTISQIQQQLEQLSNIPIEHQDYWLLNRRQGGGMRLSAHVVPVSPHQAAHQIDYFSMSLEAIFNEHMYPSHSNTVLYIRDNRLDSTMQSFYPPTAQLSAQSSSVIFVLKFFDVPSQQLKYLGSVIVSSTTTMGDMRVIMAKLLKHKLSHASLSAASADADELFSALSLDMSQLELIEADNLSIIVELDNQNEHKPYDANQFLDLDVLTDKKFQNGEMMVFSIKYPNDQLSNFKAKYSDKLAEFETQQFASVSRTATNLPAANLTPIPSTFSSIPYDYVYYLLNRVVFEFRAIPYTPKTDTSVNSSAAPTRRAGVFYVELMKHFTYNQMMERIAQIINMDPQRISLHRPALLNENVHDNSPLTRTHSTELSTFTISDILPRNPDEYILYYNIQEYTWKEMLDNVVLNITYLDVTLRNEKSFTVLIPKDGHFLDVELAVRAKLDELRREEYEKKKASTSDPASVPPVPSAAASVLRCAVVGNDKQVHVFEPNQLISVLKEFTALHNIELIVEELPPHYAEVLQSQAAHPEVVGDENAAPSAVAPQAASNSPRLIHLHRFTPFSSCYWRLCGSPISYLLEPNETVAQFRVKLIERLGLSELISKKLIIAKLTTAQYTLLDNDTNVVSSLLPAHSIQFVSLGFSDPSYKPKNKEAQPTYSFRSMYNQPVKINY